MSCPRVWRTNHPGDKCSRDNPVMLVDKDGGKIGGYSLSLSSRSNPILFTLKIGGIKERDREVEWPDGFAGLETFQSSAQGPSFSPSSVQSAKDYIVKDAHSSQNVASLSRSSSLQTSISSSTLSFRSFPPFLSLWVVSLDLFPQGRERERERERES